MKQVFVKIPCKTKKGSRKIKVKKSLVEKYKLIAGQACPFTGYTLSGRR